VLSGRQLLILVGSGVLSPGRPGAVVRQVAALGAWGLGLAGELRQAAARSPRAVAVIDERRGAVTYAALLDGADRAASVLRGLGLEAGERLGVLCRNHLMLVEVLGAAGALGADVVLLGTGLVPSQVAAACEEQGVSLLVHDDEFAEVVDASGVARNGRAGVLAESELLHGMAEAVHPRLSPPKRAGRTIVLTSGTTATPRGARRPAPRGLGDLASMLDRIPLRVGDTVLLSAPIFHAWGLAGLQLSLALRSTIVLQRTFDPAAARSALRVHGCHVMYAVPVMLQRMLALPAERSATGPVGADGGERLRVVAVSGSPLPAGLARRFMAAYGPVLHNLYGSTEVSWATVADPRDLALAPGTAGRPPLGTRVAIVDADGGPARDGQTGRIFVGNDMVFDGYTSGPQKEVWQGLVATGDLGHVEGGLLFVDGREDDLVISGGENVHAAEVEGVITRMPGVLEAAAFGVEDPEFGQRLVAYVVPEPGVELHPGQVLAHVAARVARHAHPREVVIVDALPRNETGKVLVRELRDLYTRAQQAE
jgi:acyl-CoA synthetase (AMP-forming)/AMP-acid ligase II